MHALEVGPHRPWPYIQEFQFDGDVGRATCWSVHLFLNNQLLLQIHSTIQFNFKLFVYH